MNWKLDFLPKLCDDFSLDDLYIFIWELTFLIEHEPNYCNFNCLIMWALLFLGYKFLKCRCQIIFVLSEWSWHLSGYSLNASLINYDIFSKKLLIIFCNICTKCKLLSNDYNAVFCVKWVFCLFYLS